MKKRTLNRASAFAAMTISAGGVFAGAFTHDMPKATNEKPIDVPYGEMAETFANPFGKVQTGCYWYWLGGNISPDGVVKDLEAMKCAGIERPYIGCIGGTSGGEPGPVKMFTPEWDAVLQSAFKAASRLGIDIGLFNCPGWSQSGGPWVKPGQAMRRYVSSSIVVEGPKERVVLPTPKFERAPAPEMRDVVAVAYPLPENFGERVEAGIKESISIDGDGDGATVEIASSEPFAAQAAEFCVAKGAVSGMAIVEAQSEDGAWRKICETPFSRINGAVSFAPSAPVTASFAQTVAKRFRICVKADKKRKGELAKFAVVSSPIVEKATEKSLAMMYGTPLPYWKEYKWPVEPECALVTALDPSKAVVLRGKVADDGTLDWKVPAGKWVIYRFGVAPTGAKNGPSSDDERGYEVDKMSRRHIAAHFDEYLGKIIEKTPVENRKAIRHAVLDSWEQSAQNYTDDFTGKFKAAYDYDPEPYLPALFGMAVANRDESDRFLWDMRRLVADEVAYSYVGGLRAASNAHGMGTWLECYGHWGFPGEFLQYGGQSDEVAGEYWCEGDLGDIENRAASSCAHIYGKNIVWSESNTAARREFERGPMDLKQRTDRFFAEGLNATILHVYIQQPDERKPGMNAWFGTEFNRHNTWFEHFDLYSGYLKRCGWMLRQGLNVADIAYFIGEDTPCMTGVADPAPPPGRQFDYINAEVLRETARVDEKGRIVLPHGTAYEVLVLPKLDTMRPEMLECIERLVNDGAFVMAPVKPVRSPSLAGQPQSDAKVKAVAQRLWGDGGIIDAALPTTQTDRAVSMKPPEKYNRHGKGVLAWGLSLDEALAMRGSAPDALFATTNKIAYAHRTAKNAEIYFVSNQSGEAIDEVEASFRVAGRMPEFWDAATGGRVAIHRDLWREENGRTAVSLSLAKHESVFVVFPDRAASTPPAAVSSKPPYRIDADGIAAVSSKPPYRTVEITSPWTVSFESDALHRGPKEPVVMDKLTDLSISSDSAIKHYSGKIIYRTTFNLEPSTLQPLFLDLGEVSVTAKVKVNSKDAGGVCFAPYRLDIAPFVKAGENDLEIEVCNLWVNRLVGDAEDPKRPTWTSRKCCGKNTRLPKSGLIGPVVIENRELPSAGN